MKKRMSRSNEGRRTFKVRVPALLLPPDLLFQVDSLLDRRQKEDNDMSVTNLGGFMTMTFLGYYDKVSSVRQDDPTD